MWVGTWVCVWLSVCSHPTSSNNIQNIVGRESIALWSPTMWSGEDSTPAPKVEHIFKAQLKSGHHFLPARNEYVTQPISIRTNRPGITSFLLEQLKHIALSQATLLSLRACVAGAAATWGSWCFIPLTSLSVKNFYSCSPPVYFTNYSLFRAW